MRFGNPSAHTLIYAFRESESVELVGRMVDSVGEPCRAHQSLHLRLLVVAEKALPASVKNGRYLVIRLLDNGVCTAEGRFVSQRDLGAWGECREFGQQALGGGVGGLLRKGSHGRSNSLRRLLRNQLDAARVEVDRRRVNRGMDVSGPRTPHRSERRLTGVNVGTVNQRRPNGLGRIEVPKTGDRLQQQPTRA